MTMVMLVPTKELCGQVFAVCSGLLNYLFDSVSVDCYTGDDKYKRPSLPSIMITTPRGLVQLCSGSSAHKLGSAAKSNIRLVAVDEADLVLSHGFEKDIRTIVSSVLPKEYQAVLVSATLSDDLETLKGLMLRSPLSIVINDKDITSDAPVTVSKKKTHVQGNPSCKQYFMSVTGRDKFLALYGIIKTEVISGRILIFTSSIDHAYKVKIFFDKFAIKSGVFNSEMPIECRNRVLSAFNDNLFSILIASSE
jgi:ATP-dependent RNA helicase DDX56/DBP9